MTGNLMDSIKNFYRWENQTPYWQEAKGGLQIVVSVVGDNSSIY